MRLILGKIDQCHTPVIRLPHVMILGQSTSTVITDLTSSASRYP
jgi:hypothetical protein